MSTYTKLDLSIMYAVHDALRRDLFKVAEVLGGGPEHTRRVLSDSRRWQFFTAFLTVHHTAEDEALWPLVAAKTDDAGRALLDAMEAEHGYLDPLLERVGLLMADTDADPVELSDALVLLREALVQHLGHEEREALPLLDSTLSPEEWKAFGDKHRELIGEEARTYLPWLLDGLDEDRIKQLIGRMPEPLISAYHEEWKAAYDALPDWERRTVGASK